MTGTTLEQRTVPVGQVDGVSSSTRTPRTPTPRRVPRRPRALSGTDLFLAAAAAISALASSWLIFSVVTNGIGWFGFLLFTYALFLLLYFIALYDRYGRLVAVDRTVTVATWSAMVVVMVPVLLLILYIVDKGRKGLSLGFFFHTQRGVTPTMPATAGGGLHAIVGTIEQVGLALLWSLPLGIMAAIFLNETRSRLRRPVRIFVDAMSGMPSIVSGLFIYSTLIIPLAKHNDLFNYNGFMASLALSVTMMPTICRTVEVVLRLVPDGLREAGLGLGASRARVVWSVVLPTASSGVATAAILGIAREAGETAPLLFTAFGYNLMNANPFHGAQESLPLFVYRFIRGSLQTSIDRGFAGALVLLMLILSLFALARFIGRDRTKAKTSHRSFRRTRARRPDSARTGGLLMAPTRWTRKQVTR